MANLKKKAFLSRASWIPPWWDQWNKENQSQHVSQPAIVIPQKKTMTKKSYGRSNPIGKDALIEMKRQCEIRDVPFILMYLPRALELLYDDPKMRNELKAFCKKENIMLLDLYQVFSKKCIDDKSLVTNWFLDLREGIHFSAEGCKIIAESIREHLEMEP
jgi:hypothetical protein